MNSINISPLPKIKSVKKINPEKFIKLAHEVKKIFENEEKKMKEKGLYDYRSPSLLLPTI